MPSPIWVPASASGQHEQRDGDGHHGVDEGQQAIEVAMAFGHGRTLLNRRDPLRRESAERRRHAMRLVGIHGEPAGPRRAASGG